LSTVVCQVGLLAADRRIKRVSCRTGTANWFAFGGQLVRGGDPT